MIREKKLDDCVHMLGGMRPEQVREYMERADIYLFTSDFNEGWGAVLNESMNSGCAVVASHAIGSVPFLIEDGRNGFVYKNGDIEDLDSKVVLLLNQPDLRMAIGKRAYRTIKEVWNAHVAAERFLALVMNLTNGEKATQIYNGPCSSAPILRNNWYNGNGIIE